MAVAVDDGECCRQPWTLAITPFAISLGHQPLAISLRHKRSPSAMRLGLIAGNGRFPFLVLEAARGAGHDVTLIAIKEEAFPEIAALAAKAPAAAVHWL